MKVKMLIVFCAIVLSMVNLFAKEKMAKAPTDQEINQAVSHQIYFDQFITPDSVSIKTENGIVELSGTVENLRSADRSVNIAESIKGVRSVINQLKVMSSVKPDNQVRSDVLNALILDPTTDAYKLNIDVKEGIVTLNGTVGSYSEKNLAEWVVRGIHGVRGLKDNVDIKYDKFRTDLDIAQDVEGQLRKNPYLADSLISVKVTNGIVNLSGSVGSIDAKRRAATVSWVNGTKDINLSDLKVNLWLKNDMLKSTRAVKSDQEIKEGIKDAFLYDPRVFSFNPTVNVKNKVATLSGNVSSLAAKFAAEQDAHNTVGVLSVINELKIDNLFKKTDEEIKSDVVKSLSFNLTDVQKEKINVDVKNGEVMLTGSVTNPFVKNVAFNSASRVIGVKSVTIKLTFENTVMAQNDSNLEKQIENNIQWNPYLDLNADNINVKVKNGVARLTGNVKSWKEYFEATDEAAHAGVKQVENNMSINNKKFYSTFKTESLPTIYEQDYFMTPL